MRIVIALYGLALAVRAILIALHPNAAYPDSYYYVDVARSLYAGHGFNIDFIWSFVDVGGHLPAHPMLPIPSNGHWMPLASIVQLPTMALLGPTAVASAIPFAVIGALAAPLTWLIARDFGARQFVAIGAALMVAVPSSATVFVAQPDNFALYQPLGAAALWLGARGLKGDSRSFALAGLLVGLATLARNDGVLLGAALAAAFAWDRVRAKTQRRAARIPWRAAFICGALFAIAVAPWYLRQLDVFGSISPSSSSGRILWVTTYDQQFSITGETTLASFLSQGIGPLLVSRFLGLVDALFLFSVLCSLGLVPFLVVGGWRHRRTPDFGPFFTYAALLFGASALLFAVHVPYGTFIHSAVALLPHSYILILEGICVAVAWVAARRKTWKESEATRVFIGGAVVLTIVAGVAFTAIAQRSWDRDRQIRELAGQALDSVAAPQSDLVVSADPAGYKYFTGRGGVVTPFDSVDVVKQVAQAYGARWLILEKRHIVPSMAPLLKLEQRPPWVGQPIKIVVGLGGTDASIAADPTPDLVVFPICFSSGDTRCSAPPSVASR